MSISELVTEALIESDLKGNNKFEVIEELLDLLYKNGDIKDRETTLQDLIDREQYLSTGLEGGLAVPHAKSSAVDKLMVSFGLHRDGLDFDSLDGKPAHCIFLVLSPRDISGPHIKILAQITRNFREGEIGRNLINSKSATEIYQLIKDFK